MESQAEANQSRTQGGRQKKPYAAPQLLMYGNIREITQNVGSKNNTDNGAPPNQKTQA
jgi:hypothetical protein